MPSKENEPEPNTHRDTQITTSNLTQQSNPAHPKAKVSPQNHNRAGKNNILRLIGGKFRAEKVPDNRDYWGNTAKGRIINPDQQGPSCSVSESPEQFCGVYKFLATEEGVNPGSQAQQEIPESH